MTDRLIGDIAYSAQGMDSGVEALDAMPLGFPGGEPAVAGSGRESRMASRREAWRAAVRYGGEDAADRRRYVLRLTPVGRAELARLRPLADAVEQAMTGALTPSEVTALRRLLHALLTA